MSNNVLQKDGQSANVLNCTAGTLMTLITFFGQIMVFIVVAKDPRLRTPSSYFIVSLATADFLISIISMPVWTVYSTIGYWPVSQVSKFSASFKRVKHLWVLNFTKIMHSQLSPRVALFLRNLKPSVFNYYIMVMNPLKRF